MTSASQPSSNATPRNGSPSAVTRHGKRVKASREEDDANDEQPAGQHRVTAERRRDGMQRETPVHRTNGRENDETKTTAMSARACQSW
jgi:hypothetical protein